MAVSSVNTTTNMTTSTGMSKGMQTYYDRRLLSNMKSRLVHTQFGQKRVLPLNSGLTIQFRRWQLPTARTTALSEGVTPTGQMMTQSEVTATIAQYGGHFEITDKLAKTHLDRVVAEAMDQVSYQGALTLDHLTRDVINAGTQVIYANSKTGRTNLTASDLMTGKEIRQAVRLLKKKKARPVRGNYYVCIVGPDVTFALQQDDDWVKVSQYQDKENIYSGEVGKLWGCIFVETTEAKVWEDGGATTGSGATEVTADVASALVLGAEAYGVIELDGKGVHTIVHPAGSSGTYDPLDQISTVGWKVDGFVCKILNDEWMVRIESGVAA